MHMMLDVRKVPVDRLIANLEQEYQKTNSPHVALRLGRLNGIAYSWKADSVMVIDGPTEPARGTEIFYPGSDEPAIVHENVVPPPNDAARERAQKHLERAIYWYQIAIDWGGGGRRARLGYGWCLMEAGYKDQAKDVFRGIVAEAFGVDTDREGGRFGGKSVTAEALTYLIGLLNPVTDFSEKRMRESQLEDVEADWSDARSPIVIPLRDNLTVQDVVRDDRVVTFNLDYGACDRWTWIDPRAGWLVHDFLDIGDIVSGRDLIGDVAFGVFWDNGYQVLSALDDNHDGVLREGELVGLKVWRDANMNGVCDPGELLKLEQLGIAGLSCSCTPIECNGREMWQSTGGVLMTDGTARDSYDVMLQAAEAVVGSIR